MVATSQPLATEAGLRALRSGGNAADAAVVAAAVLCVTEPMSTGIGGDAFALVWSRDGVSGLDAAGPAPRGAASGARVAPRGPESVTVPGAVGGWAALLDRHGTWGLDACLAPAVEVAEQGFAVGAHCARMWSEAPTPPRPLPPAPRPRERVAMPDLARTLRGIASAGPRAFYRGPVADAIAEASWLAREDLERYAPRWVQPLRLTYHGVEVVELPPPTQGVAALEALGLLAELGGGLTAQVRAARLALADAAERVRDGAEVGDLIEPGFLRRRSSEAARGVGDRPGGTVCLCVVDRHGMAVSFIQSLFEHFGSGVVAEGTGVVLNNRAAGFAIAGSVTPGARPYHTLIPGLLLRDGGLVGPFGVMGGLFQAQGHMQLVAALVDEGLDPQAALDRPRFRLEGDAVRLERGLWDRGDDIRALGLEPIRDEGVAAFGGGQVVLVGDRGLVGGSDRRKDGYAAAA